MGNTFSSSKPDFAKTAIYSPYANALVSEAGSTYALNNFLTSQNKMIEQTVPKLYDRLFNPTFDDAISQARIQAFQKAFNQQSKNAFENNLINPLSERRMLRSSLLNDLSNNFQKTQASQIADFNNELLSNSVSETQSLINSLMNQYMSSANFGNKIISLAQALNSNINKFNSNGYSTSSRNNMSGDFLNFAAEASTAIMTLLETML